MSRAGQTGPDMQTHEYPPDRGCAASPRCLDCPLPKCIEEVRGEAREIKVRDLHMLDALRRGVDIDHIVKFYSVVGKRTGDKRRSVYRALARARLYERAVGISPHPVAREDANGALDVRVRLHLPALPKPKRKPVIHTRDWHDKLVILRAWGYSLGMIGYAADRLDHSSVLHHLREECRCGQAGAWLGFRPKVDVAARAVA